MASDSDFKPSQKTSDSPLAHLRMAMAMAFNGGSNVLWKRLVDFHEKHYDSMLSLDNFSKVKSIVNEFDHINIHSSRIHPHEIHDIIRTFNIAQNHTWMKFNTVANTSNQWNAS